MACCAFRARFQSTRPRGRDPDGGIYAIFLSKFQFARSRERDHEADGSLVPRGAPGALVEDPAAAARCALSLVLERRTVARNGQPVPLAVDTLCVHGDTPNAPAIAAEVRAALVEAEIIVRSLKGWRPEA